VSIIPTLGRERQEKNHKFEANLGYIASPYIQKKKKFKKEDNVHIFGIIFSIAQ
jgi:hypothetical protein